MVQYIQFNLTFCAIVKAPVGAGSPTALKGADRFNKLAPTGFFRYFKRGRLRLMVVWGGFMRLWVFGNYCR